jgi:subtilase family serine protease
MARQPLGIILVFLALVLACQSPPLNSHPTPSPSAEVLPDLRITNIYVEMQGRTGNCVEAYTNYEIRVVVENAGDASALPFQVALNSQQQLILQGLPAGQSTELHFSLSAPNGQYEAVADPANQVRERDENNNRASYQAITPTPPLRCTPVQPALTTPSP